MIRKMEKVLTALSKGWIWPVLGVGIMVYTAVRGEWMLGLVLVLFVGIMVILTTFAMRFNNWLDRTLFPPDPPPPPLPAQIMGPPGPRSWVARDWTK